MKISVMSLTGIFAAHLLVVPATVLAQQADDLSGKQIKVAPNINTSVQSEALNYLVNTPYKEYGPMPTKDGKRLYFSRQGYPDNLGGVDDEDIWYCEFDDESQTWTQAVNIGPPLNNTGPNFVTGVGRNGDTLLLGNVYGKKGRMTAGVSLSIKIGELWSNPVPINIAGDYNLSGKAGYDLSADRTALVIAQEKSDTYGKLDLYVAFRDPNAKYPYSATESINLGPVINSFGEETSPWLAYDGRTLYFSSDGHNGLGKLDIFMAKRLDKSWTNWSQPVNLGPGINSHYDDMSFNYNPTSRYAFFSRGVTPTNVDIYRVDMTSLFKDVKSSDPTGLYADEIGQTRVVADVFDDGQPIIKKEAMEELQKMAKYLLANKTMFVQVGAHSNRHGTRAESIKLANQRAGVVIEFLVKNGVDRKRLSFQGFGHDIVINSNNQSTSLSSGGSMASSVEFKVINYEN
ncbi:MAG TPA: OmpA family protein [Cyclobacteriaceae bacterium]|nr:OmpA family protein [Cyclobacteriaceae bacterium]